MDSIACPPELIVVSGTSGSGKSTLTDLALERGLGILRVVTMTDRAPRSYEEDGVHYHFRSTEVFRKMIEEGALYEWAEVYGNLKGVPRFALDEIRSRGACPLMVLDIQGVQNWKRILGPDKVRSIFVVPALPASVEEEIMGGEPRSDAERADVERRGGLAAWREFRAAESLRALLRERLVQRDPSLEGSSPGELTARVSEVLTEVQFAKESPDVDFILKNRDGELEQTFQDFLTLVQPGKLTRPRIPHLR